MTLGRLTLSIEQDDSDESGNRGADQNGPQQPLPPFVRPGKPLDEGSHRDFPYADAQNAEGA